MKLTAVFQKVPEGYIAFVEELAGANTQGETLEEARSNLVEAITLVIESNRLLAEESLYGCEVIRETFEMASL
jgi:predicted RNase H-like HicB family nuclease